MKRRRARAPQVLVREVENHLIVGVGVNRRHGAADDLELVLQDLGDRRQAVRGAGSVRNNVMLGGIVLLVVHAQHEGDVFILRRSRDDDFLHRPAQMLLGVVGIGEAAGRFDHDLRAHGFPRQRGRIFFFEYLDGLAVDRNAVGAGGNLVRQVAENRVVLQKMGQRFRIGQIVDRDEIQVWIFERSAQNVAADSSEAIDANFNCHVSSVRFMKA